MLVWSCATYRSRQCNVWPLNVCPGPSFFRTIAGENSGLSCLTLFWISSYAVWAKRWHLNLTVITNRVYQRKKKKSLLLVAHILQHYFTSTCWLNIQTVLQTLNLFYCYSFFWVGQNTLIKLIMTFKFKNAIASKASVQALCGVRQTNFELYKDKKKGYTAFHVLCLIWLPFMN